MDFFNWLYNLLYNLLCAVVVVVSVAFVYYWIDTGSYHMAYNKSVVPVMKKLSPVNVSGEISDVTGIELIEDKRLWNERKGHHLYYINGDPVIHIAIIKGELLNNAHYTGCISTDEKELYSKELKSLIDEYNSDNLVPGTGRLEHLYYMNDAALLEIESKGKQFSDPLVERCGYEIVDYRDEDYIDVQQ